MVEPMTDGERMIWAAAFAANIDKDSPDLQSAMRAAFYAVWNARLAMEDSDGIISASVNAEHLAMLRDMLGEDDSCCPHGYEDRGGNCPTCHGTPPNS